MKKILFLFAFALLIPAMSHAQDTFRLDASQSMLMTGKGAGQDGAINPYAGQNCIAVVENIGQHEVSIRVQQKGQVLQTLTVAAGQTQMVKLLKGHELYLDATDKGKVKAKLSFEPLEE